MSLNVRATDGIQDLQRLFLIVLFAVMVTGSVAVFFISSAARGLPVFAGIVLKSGVVAGIAGVLFYLYIFRRLVGEIIRRTKAEEDVAAAAESEKKRAIAAKQAAAEYEKKSAAAAALAGAEYVKNLAAAMATAAVEQKKQADRAHDLEQQIAAGEQRLLAAYQRVADHEQELRVVKAGLEQKVKEGVRELLELKVKERTRKIEEARDVIEAEVRAANRALSEEKDKGVRMSLLIEERDMRVIEIKKEVNRLSKELGQAEPYWRG